ncbi:hypothetical protein [Paenibacillus guangzhouensis]|uniref:hypothetical protein n=1 Tax=Paenibacillus guangzhouensis TaxID=1473112 RepID=UPI001266E057|nr:hypothetical protein [Paenibacillus guangzhouensis]
MKRTIIGATFLFMGSLISLAILIAAALYIPSITAWRGTKLWFAIYGANDMGNDVQSLFLGLPFTVGIVLFILGFIVLVFEYFNKS